MADNVVFQGELVGVLFGLWRFRVEQGIAVFGFASLAKRQVPLLRNEAHVLKRVGMGQRNPNFERLPGRDTLHGEGIVELEMALALGVGGKGGEHGEYERQSCGKAAGDHGNCPFGRDVGRNVGNDRRAF